MLVIGKVPAKQLWGLVGVTGGLAALGLAFIFVVGSPSSDSEELAVDGEEVTEVTTSKKGVFHRAETWRNRILSFASHEEIEPSKVDVTGNDAQKIFAHIAIASSNGLGVGPGNSELRDWLPHAYDDFIFAIILEELGLLGGLFVAILYITFLFRVRRIAHQCDNNFPAFLAMGLCLLICVQAVFNMWVAVGLAPVTGQPLPLISKGGTSSVINCIYVGVILSVSRSAKKREEAVTEAELAAVDQMQDDDSKVVIEAD